MSYFILQVIKMVVVVAMSYAISHLPMHVLNCLQLWELKAILGFRKIWILAGVFAYSSTCCNPIVYAWMNRAFRNYCKSRFRDRFTCIGSKNHQTRESTAPSQICEREINSREESDQNFKTI
ncbi:hypothetical protein Ciccas_005914 [Cichlidogyrus casuarinus]|uniref:Uncharacterized protein n=1 Tax=Cichlidogyrus casuarinus TaxID=1844966 RepID=A0ABD2Q7A5_9PLAT